ncbi:MAG: tRNA nucleotidyltransferase/poly(A) polymerase family protein [Leptospirales bacterium]
MTTQIDFRQLPFWHRLLGRLPVPEGGQAYIVGGWVRDLLYFGHPCKLELDWSIPGNAIAWARMISDEFRVPVSAESSLGTAKLAIVHEGVSVSFDLASCRKESYPVPGGLPHTLPASIEEDLRRRDFSINALAISILFPVPENALLIDPCGGQEDLRQKKLRILHDASFYDDPTRIFRSIRFHHRLGLVFSEETEDALVRERESGSLFSVSRSRLWDELRNMIAEEDPLPIVYEWLVRRPWGKLLSLHDTGPRRQRLMRWFGFQKDAHHFLRDRKYNPEFLFLLAFLYGLSRREVKKTLDLFGVPLRVRERINGTLFQNDDMGVFHYFEERCGNEEESWWREAGRIAPESAYLLALRSPVERRGFWVRFFRSREESQPLLTGEDLAPEGIFPSGKMGEILLEIRNLQRMGKLSSRQDALEWVRSQMR